VGRIVVPVRAMFKAFVYRRGLLHAENVRLDALAERYGTPLYIYSATHLRSQFRALSNAMAAVSPLICYSMKANSCGAVLRTLLREGAGVDVVSGGELFRALRAGADPAKIVFAGVGKTVAEIEFALRSRILFFTVESEPEAERISACARRLRTTARIAIRVNPDVDPGTHRHITTGRAETKFGIDLLRAERACQMVMRLPHTELVGLHIHIGSQILDARPFGEAIDRISPLCAGLRRECGTFRYLDAGGGIGIPYKPSQKELSPREFAAEVAPRAAALGLNLVMEPGRFLVGNAGVLVCRVQYVKQSGRKRFVIVDAGMNDLIRPVLYDAYHQVVPVRRIRVSMKADVVGPICESGDFLARDRMVPSVHSGDLLAVLSAGAYGFAMSSSYNSRPRPAEVLVDGTRVTLARRRETWQDLMDKETSTAIRKERK